MPTNSQLSSKHKKAISKPTSFKKALQTAAMDTQCQEKELDTNKRSRLCSLHFTQDRFIPVQGGNTLKPDAVPTIFYPHCQVKVKVRHTKVSKNTMVSKTDSDTQAGKHRNISHDHDYISCTHSKPQTKKLKIQDQRLRRLKQKVKSLSSVVTDLNEKLLVSTSCGDMLEASFSGVAKEILTRQYSCRPRLYRGIIRCPPIPCGGRKERW
uniref:THAP-type domain-containing protein n=1 Tax=Cyprinus carpio TaxID=7962 RepID=A0A8C2JQD0_CYPCA